MENPEAIKKLRNSEEFRKALKVAKKENASTAKLYNLELNKSILTFNPDGNPLKVVDMDMRRTFQRSLLSEDTITLESKNAKKLDFRVVHDENSKFYFSFEPNKGELKKGHPQQITFSIGVYCTTKAYQVVKILIREHASKHHLSTKRSAKKLITSPESALTLGFKIQSELSSVIDYDEIEFGKPIGEGGYGTVFKGTWRGTEVALKKLNTQDFVDEEKEMVMREIMIMNKLKNPHIVTYMGATLIPGQPLVIAMEYIPGGSLTGLIKTNISPGFRCKILIDICRGVSFLHSHDIYHRDIKPDNVLVVSSSPDSNTNIKITDFGTSRPTLAQQDNQYEELVQGRKRHPPKETKKERRLTKGVGTLLYQAPEIISSQPQVNVEKTDVYSMGVLMWETMTGQEPYSHAECSNMSRWELESYILKGGRPPITDAILPALSALIKKCWAEKPQSRPGFIAIQRELEVIGSQLNTSIPTPLGNLNLLGWVKDMSRVEVEARLKSEAVGTFALRWSENSGSYVLSYTDKEGVNHIGFIKPKGPGGDSQIEITKQNGETEVFENLFKYIAEMQEVGIIKNPMVQAPQNAPESNYTFSPTN